jgi:polyisoprenoid-binding protein YceI
MKTMIQNLVRLTSLSVMLFATSAYAQPTVKETTTTSSGTISQFGPESIVVKTTTSTDPISYSYTKTTTYVDEKGNPVSIETVQAGLPVTIYYDKAGNKMVATKVVVTKAVLADPHR